MEYIAIKNLRAFSDTKLVELKPLTVAVGKNSCGKSTFLRVFPLLKQTLEVKVSEPILWYGRYTDFGDYRQAKHTGSDSEPISFSFKFKLNEQYSHECKDVSLNICVEENIK